MKQASKTGAAYKERPDGLKDLSAISFGWVSSVGFFVCCGAGYWADQKWHTGFQWTLVGVFVGISLVVYELWKILKNLNRSNTEKK